MFANVAARVRPDLAGAFAWTDNRALREEIAAIVPLYDGIQHLSETGDQVQWGGRHLCAGGVFPTPSGRGRFTPLTPADAPVPDGCYVVTTRRGKQFNSMVQGRIDPLTGADRDAVFIDVTDARAARPRRRRPGDARVRGRRVRLPA